MENGQSLCATFLNGIQRQTSRGFSRGPSRTDASSPSGDRQVLFVMGGRQVSVMETLGMAPGPWVTHNILDPPSDMTCICSMEQKILVFELEREKFRSFDVLTREWRLLRSPPRYSFGSSMSYSGHHVYVLGEEYSGASRCYRYDFRLDQWSEMASVIPGRDFAGTVCFEEKLYCSGGLSLFENSIALQVLDLQEDGQWSPLPSMIVNRFKHSLVSCGRFLFAIGGRYEGVRVSGFTRREHSTFADVERYDVELRQWSFVSSLPVRSFSFSSVVFEGRIHVIGGQVGGFEAVSTVYVYDEEDDLWDSGFSLNFPRYDHGSCVVRIPSDAVADQYVGNQDISDFYSALV